MTQENPYSALLQTFRRYVKQGEGEPWTMGTVVSASPLCISVKGIALSGRDLMVNPQLLNWEAPLELGELKGTIQGQPTVSVSSGQVAGKGKMGTILKAGDMVAMLPFEDGRFLILCKVVAV